MILVRRFFGLCLDSPTYGRDRANLLTGFSVGIVGLLLNAAVLMIAMPFLMAPEFRGLSQSMEFGQLLALVLLGGASSFATVLIPLRLATVFWEPRIGRYFDQIVLSGISPLRFVIGKVLSQNLFLGLVLFLLVPYFVFSLTLGGVNFVSLASGLFLVWLYCMALALVTLWLSLYVNELFAALLVIATASIISMLGSAPFPFQPFVVTPFPTLVQPVYASIPRMDSLFHRDYWTTFASCAIGMTTLSIVSLVAISLGPLYGIIRENSTFGEVVRAGDSKRKRTARFRPLIQRSSEIAFFYKNRARSSRSNEGIVRWGFGFLGLLLLITLGDLSVIVLAAKQLPTWTAAMRPWYAFEFFAFCLTIHGFALALAAILFSHPKNSTYVRLPFVRGWTTVVSNLDTTAFLLFALISSTATVATPFLFELYVAAPGRQTIFPVGIQAPGGQPGTIDFTRIAIEGTLVISIAGLVVYALQRLVCLMTWTRILTSMATGLLYFLGICLAPLFAGVIILETSELRRIPILTSCAPSLAVTSPMMMMMKLFNGAMGMPFPAATSTVPFYVVHGVLLVLIIFETRRRGRKVRALYLVQSVQETVDG